MTTDAKKETSEAVLFDQESIKDTEIYSSLECFFKRAVKVPVQQSSTLLLSADEEQHLPGSSHDSKSIENNHKQEFFNLGIVGSTYFLSRVPAESVFDISKEKKAADFFPDGIEKPFYVHSPSDYKSLEICDKECFGISSKRGNSVTNKNNNIGFANNCSLNYCVENFSCTSGVLNNVYTDAENCTPNSRNISVESSITEHSKKRFKPIKIQQNEEKRVALNKSSLDQRRLKQELLDLESSQNHTVNSLAVKELQKNCFNQLAIEVSDFYPKTKALSRVTKAPYTKTVNFLKDSFPKLPTEFKVYVAKEVSSSCFNCEKDNNVSNDFVNIILAQKNNSYEICKPTFKKQLQNENKKESPTNLILNPSDTAQNGGDLFNETETCIFDFINVNEERKVPIGLPKFHDLVNTSCLPQNTRYSLLNVTESSFSKSNSSKCMKIFKNTIKLTLEAEIEHRTYCIQTKNTLTSNSSGCSRRSENADVSDEDQVVPTSSFYLENDLKTDIHLNVPDTQCVRIKNPLNTNKLDPSIRPNGKYNTVRIVSDCYKKLDEKGMTLNLDLVDETKNSGNDSSVCVTALKKYANNKSKFQKPRDTKSKQLTLQNVPEHYDKYLKNHLNNEKKLLKNENQVHGMSSLLSALESLTNLNHNDTNDFNELLSSSNADTFAQVVHNPCEIQTDNQLNEDNIFAADEDIEKAIDNSILKYEYSTADKGIITTPKTSDKSSQTNICSSKNLNLCKRCLEFEDEEKDVTPIKKGRLDKSGCEEESVYNVSVYQNKDASSQSALSGVGCKQNKNTNNDYEIFSPHISSIYDSNKSQSVLIPLSKTVPTKVLDAEVEATGEESFEEVSMFGDEDDTDNNLSKVSIDSSKMSLAKSHQLVPAIDQDNALEHLNRGTTILNSTPVKPVLRIGLSRSARFKPLHPK